jgi:hypothetical protein
MMILSMTKTDLIVVILQTLVLYDLLRLFVSITLQLIGHAFRRRNDADE